MQKVNLPYQALEIMQRLFERHYTSYVCGGAVRELLTGGMPLDYDIITDCSAERITAIFSPDHIVKEDNARRGEIIVMVRGMAIMVSPYRKSFDETELPEYTNDVLCDLERRDFTFNAICADMNGELFDPFAGADCLVSEPYVIEAVKMRGENGSTPSVSADPIALMSALALLSEGEHIISPETSARIHEAAESVAAMRKNELRLLFERILMGKRSADVLMEYRDVAFAIFPELIPTDGFDCHSKFHSLALYEHLCKSVGYAPPSCALRYALLLHGAGKPDCEAMYPDGHASFFGHSQRGSIYARRALIRLNMPPDMIDGVCFLIENHDICENPRELNISELKNQFTLNDLRQLLLFGSANLRAKAPECEQEAYALRKLGDQLSQW